MTEEPLVAGQDEDDEYLDLDSPDDDTAPDIGVMLPLVSGTAGTHTEAEDGIRNEDADGSLDDVEDGDEVTEDELQ